MTTGKEIVLVQVPVIKHELLKIGKSVTDRIAKLNLDKQVATDETVKTLKEIRATLNKELTNFEEQRKSIKKGVNAPYDEFEEIYKIEISEKYKTATSTLSDKIAEVEDKVKEAKQNNIKSYFAELCASEGIDFIKYENLNLDINLSTTEKAYKIKCNEYIQKVLDDLSLIKTNEFEAEILVEYKQTLNASKSIITVQNRKEEEQKEKDRIHFQEIQTKKNTLVSLGMQYNEMVKVYEFSNDIIISLLDVESLSKEDFDRKAIELGVRITQAKSITTNPVQEAAEQPITAPINNVVIPKPEILNAPTVEVKEEIVEASFTCSGTMKQLKELGQYMKDNNITYKNI